MTIVEHTVFVRCRFRRLNSWPEVVERMAAQTERTRITKSGSMVVTFEGMNDYVQQGCPCTGMCLLFWSLPVVYI